MKLTEGGKELVSKNLIYPMLHISNGSLLGKPSIPAANKLSEEKKLSPMANEDTHEIQTEDAEEEARERKELADKERTRIGEYKLCKM